MKAKQQDTSSMGEKGVGDEVLELPIGIMQDNTQVSWLATRGLSPLPQGPWEQTQQHALYWGPNAQGLWEQTNQHPLVPRLCWGPNPQGLWEQTKQHPLVPRLCWGPNRQGLWEQTQQCALVPRLCWPLGTITTTTTTLGVPLSQESWPCESMGQKGDLYGALHPLPLFI